MKVVHESKMQSYDRTGLSAPNGGAFRTMFYLYISDIRMAQHQQEQVEQSNGMVMQMTDHADLTMIFGMRLLLAITALLTLFINLEHMGVSPRLAWSVLSLYAVHSVVLFVLLYVNVPATHGRLIFWLDVLWYGLIVLCTGGGESYFFPFFFFVILTSSFQRGLDEGARITLASCLLLGLVSVAGDSMLNIPKLLLRMTFVMALGYMIAYWGGLSLLQKRRLALLREMSQQSNPRFGVDHTVAAMLEKARVFFGASSCILIMRESGAEHWQLRTALSTGAGRQGYVSQMSEAAVAPLMGFGARQSVLYSPSLRARAGLGHALAGFERGGMKWQRLDRASGAALAELLDAKSFISAPLPLRKGEGRIYIVATSHHFFRADARFLMHLVAHVFPLVENIALLDTLASGAAFRERQKIARDLHDTTIQPYIGLRHGLSALRASAAPDNPLLSELDKLIDMSGQVIGDLRHMAQSVRSGAQREEMELVVALRRQAEQLKKFFGLDVEIVADQSFHVSDRLAAEVFQIVNEGMSNMRKHTTARGGRVVLTRDTHVLTISIENERTLADAAVAVEFMPVSITERAQALGGTVQVGRAASGMTMVRIDIPV